MHESKAFLEHIAYNMRRLSLQMTTQAGSGHPTSALSAADMVAALFFYAMQYDPKNPENLDNDRFILSKGHASPILYAVYKELGILSESELLTYRDFNSVLEGHPTPRFRWSEAATGSLGQGLSVAAGMALAARIDNRDYKTYVLLGDSELSEGSNWEAAELAAYNKLNNLIGIIDCNRLGQRGETMHGYHVQRYAEKFHAFGWRVYIVDGHDMQEIIGALEKARAEQEMPVMIIAKTVKGYGVELAENKNGFHGKVFSKEELPRILQHMHERFAQAADYKGESFLPCMPVKHDRSESFGCVGTEPKTPTYKKGELFETRKAYGQALASLGGFCRDIVVLDAEVSNSTYAQFFAEKYPERFIECFIAEQNMIGMAVGMHKRGKVPYCSTFGAFFTRAYDQIRMASIGAAALRLVGSHAGVSIGQDGPSQMALEDIAMIRTIYGSCVLYPSDAVSAWHLVNQMVEYNQGISYLRTTRLATPVIYDVLEEFPIGGCKIVRQSKQDKVCVIGAGITLHNALAAHLLLMQEGIEISVIDLYSIKPLDHETVIAVARASGNKVITVEDHYLEGGLGQAVVYALRDTDIQVHCLAVRKLPRSGTPERLMAYEDIDPKSIVEKVKELMR
jgi:transketolase